MSGQDYPPPGQHTITDFTAEQDHVEPSMPHQNVLHDKQTMPPQQPMPQMQYMMGCQGMSQQQYVQQMPSQQYYKPQQQMPGQPMPQYYQQMPAQQFPGSSGQPMPGPMVGQPPSPFLNVPLQQWTTGLFDCAQDMENSKPLV